MTDKPSDAEILELASQYWYSLDETESETEIELVRAALAKWGQPAQAAEPVAKFGIVHHISEFRVVADWYGTLPKPQTKLYTAPQPVARRPEFDQFLSDVMTAAGLVTHGKQCKQLGERLGAAVMKLRVHGIKGGQHGDAKP